MNLQQLNPWNWFSHEETRTNSTIPVKRHESAADTPQETESKLLVRDQLPVIRLRQEFDRLFDQAFQGFGFPSLRTDWLNDGVFSRAGFQAKLNVASDDKQYHISLEAPGLTEKDISLEVSQGVLTIRGEKKEETETNDRHYYRVERNYGNFQRVLNLPEDVDQETIAASLKNGVLDIIIPRRPTPETPRKRIPIN